MGGLGVRLQRFRPGSFFDKGEAGGIVEVREQVVTETAFFLPGGFHVALNCQPSGPRALRKKS
jgi:hypothetical protein